MTDPKALARAIAARTKPRFIDTNPKPKTLEERLALAREIAARTPPRFIEIPRERGGGKIHYTEEQLTAMRDGLTAEQYRWKKIRKWRKAAQTGPDEPRPAPPLAVMVGPRIINQRRLPAFPSTNGLLEIARGWSSYLSRYVGRCGHHRLGCSGGACISLRYCSCERAAASRINWLTEGRLRVSRSR
jgi:hypothetical protein